MPAVNNRNVPIKILSTLAEFLVQDNMIRAAVVARLGDSDNYVRAGAVEALTGLVGSETDIRAAVVARLGDSDNYVRAAAVEALAGLVGSDADIRAAVVARLGDSDNYVRVVAVQALAGLVGSDADIRAAVVARLGDSDNYVRAAAVQALAGLVEVDDSLRQRLQPFLGSDDQLFRIYSLREENPGKTLEYHWGRMIANDMAARSEVINLLNSVDWRLRRSAAEILAEAGQECLAQARLPLLTTLEDNRGLDVWPAHIAVAELFLNDDRFAAEATNMLIQALDYGAHPLIFISDAGDVRRQAALALGKLKASFRQPHVFARLERLLQEERDPEVLDAAFNAMQSLAAVPEIEEFS
ncbi:MAG: HEAT repeat domain-containing protein [Chloroflexi bacterium]|nr:HEAT repeat domain-containing protein [Chloroflexota bacterium]